MSFSRLNYPSSFASEGNPAAGGLIGEYDPYIHGVNDTIWINNEVGYFSVDVSSHPPLEEKILAKIILQHMARFTELAIAFAVEQAGWDNEWR
jgi:leucyl aminopeptidase